MAAHLDHGSDELQENHDINVTPFIDVMLVLLIIFMVAAPLATVQVPVDLPASTATPVQPAKEPIFVTVQADKTLSVGEQPVTAEALPDALNLLTGQETEQRIFLRADKTVDYGTLMGVMNTLRDAGYLKVALVGLETLPTAPAVQ